MDGVVIDESHMLLKGMVHESNSILFVRIIVWNHFRLIFEPFDLISPDAIHTTSAHTVASSCTEEP